MGINALTGLTHSCPKVSDFAPAHDDRQWAPGVLNGLVSQVSGGGKAAVALDVWR
jgi:hypothetical protein